MCGYMRGPGIIFWRAGPLQYRFLLGECSRDLSVPVCQLVLLWQAACGFSEFFWTLFQCVCPFQDGWIMSAECPAVFDQKWHYPHDPPSLFTWSHTEQLYFVSQIKKSHQGEMFCRCGRSDTKMGETLNVIKINEFKNCFEQWKKVLIGVLHWMKNTLKVTKV